MLAQWLSRTPTMAALRPAKRSCSARFASGWAAQRLGRCPIAAAAARLGCPRAAAHLHLLLEEVGAAWPEPFAVSPLCCARLSHDEATFAEMIAAGARGDRPGFDRLLSDLLPADARERLFLSAEVLNRVLKRACV
jgi:hypothetical protein